MDIGSHKLEDSLVGTRASSSSRATSRSTTSGSSTTSRSATSSCRSSRSPRRPNTSRTRCGSSSSISRPTSPSSASARNTRSASSSRRPPRSTACAPTRELDEATNEPGLRPDRQAALDLRLLEAAARPRDLRLRRARQRRLHALPPVQLDRAEARQRLRAEGGQLAPLHAVHLERHLPRSRSSWSTAASRAAPSPSSTTASTRCCASSKTRTAAPTAASSTSAIPRAMCRCANWPSNCSRRSRLSPGQDAVSPQRTSSR